jgi:hypothetical protein
MKTTKTQTELNQLIANVAVALGATVKAGADEGRGTIIMPDGVQFFCNADYYGSGGMMQISSAYPAHVNNAQGEMRNTVQSNFNGDAPHFSGIKVSVDKSPEQIAKDIMRRFMPTYAPLYAQSVAWCASWAEYHKQQDVMQRLGAELFAYQSGRKVNASVEYAGKDRLDVRVSGLNADQAKALAALLATF